MGRIATERRRSAGLSASPTANPVGTETQEVAVPFIDPANPGPWLASLSASRRRRAEAARERRRKRAGRGGGAVLLAAMTLVAGGAVAADGPASSGARAVVGASGTSSRSSARSACAADGVIGPVTRRAIRNYQRNHGLAVDGIAGPATLGSLGISRLDGAKTKTPATRTAGGSATLARIAQCESSGNPTAVSSERPLPRQVPVLARHLARARRQRRSGQGARVRPGRDGGQAARPARHLALAGLRLGSRLSASEASPARPASAGCGRAGRRRPSWRAGPW